MFVRGWLYKQFLFLSCDFCAHLPLVTHAVKLWDGKERKYADAGDLVRKHRNLNHETGASRDRQLISSYDTGWCCSLELLVHLFGWDRIHNVTKQRNRSNSYIYIYTAAVTLSKHWKDNEKSSRVTVQMWRRTKGRDQTCTRYWNRVAKYRRRNQVCYSSLRFKRKALHQPESNALLSHYSECVIFFFQAVTSSNMS